MPSVKVDVTVIADGATVDRLKSRPVRRIPSGHGGVVFAGEVFPLHDGNVIDLADERYSKAECSSFFRFGQQVSYAPARRAEREQGRLQVGRWNVEKNQFGNYLVFDADDETAARVAELVNQLGLGNIRWDVSQREADDGYRYGWFIRLSFAGARDEVIHRVQGALGPREGASRGTAATDAAFGMRTSLKSPKIPGPVWSPKEPEFELRSEITARESEITRLQTIVEGLFGTVDAWQNAHAELTTRAAALEEDLSKALANVRELDRRLREEQRKRSTAEATAVTLEQVREEIRAQRSLTAEAQIAQVEQNAEDRIAHAELDRRAAEQLGEEAEERAAIDRMRLIETESRLASQEAELRRLTEVNLTLEALVDEVQTAQAEKDQLLKVERARQGSTGRTSADGFAESLLPRISFYPEALETLVMLKDPSRIFEVLVKLNARESVPAEPFRSSATKGMRVMEVKGHFHVGDEGKQSGMGRIYFVRDDEKLLCYVHRKQDDKEQDQAVERFASWCRKVQNM